MTKVFCLVTKTYRGDLSAFTDLCRSIDQFMPDVRHVVLHDRRDREMIAAFAGPQRELVDCNDLLPGLREVTIAGRTVWWRAPFFPVRGWIYQQLAKIAAVALLNEDAAVLIDSDARFVSPIRHEHLFDGDRVRLFHRPGAPSGPVAESPKWHNVASQALGLTQRGYTGADYISNAVIWSPAVVRQMIERIERATGDAWFDPLIRPRRFSEYVLYGVFCEHVAGKHKELFSLAEGELAHCSWHYDFGSDEEIDRFVAEFDESKIAVLIQSNLSLSDAKREAIFNRIERHRASAPSVR